MKLIVKMPNWVGDLVMATPVLQDLRTKFPEAEITAMARDPIAVMLQHDPAVDALFAYARPANGFLRRQLRRDLILKLRAGDYDVGVLLTRSFSSAWWFWAGRVKRRIGYAGNWRSLLLTDALERPEGTHQVEEYKRLLSPLGIFSTQSVPRLIVTDSEREVAREWLRQRGVHPGMRLVGINPGATYGSAKCWPLERFRALSLKLLEDPKMALVFFGDQWQVELVREICRGLPERVLNSAGATTLRELMALIGQCSAVVTNDSGPMHIAAALDIPLVALFGSTSPERTGPWGRSDAVMSKRAACAPCYRRVCPIDFRCMREIGVDEVVAKVRVTIDAANTQT